MTNVTVFTLHGIACKSLEPLLQQDPAMVRYTITQQLFQYLLSQLSPKNSYTVGSLKHQQDFDSYTITFDDGLISDYEMAFPRLVEHDIKATFYVTASNIGVPGYCDKAQLREMSSAGMEIGSHGLTHRYLTLMPENEAKNEIRQSKQIIEDILGCAVTSYAAVGGHFQGWMRSYATEVGYRSFASMIPGKTTVDGAGAILLRRNHLQDTHGPEYIRELINGSRGFHLKNVLHYYALYLPKVVLGMRNYDALKGLLLGNPGAVEQK